MGVRLDEADEYLHELGPEPNFNESMYLNCFDHEQGVGGWFRIGNRANEGRAEGTVCLYLPTGAADVLPPDADAAPSDGAPRSEGGPPRGAAPSPFVHSDRERARSLTGDAKAASGAGAARSPTTARAQRAGRARSHF